MDNLTSVPEHVIEFFGELYVHEPDDVRARIQFRDYLGLLLHERLPVSLPHGPLHAHRCICETLVLCETPAGRTCAHNPRCRNCGPLPLNGAHHSGLKLVASQRDRPARPSLQQR